MEAGRYRSACSPRRHQSRVVDEQERDEVVELLGAHPRAVVLRHLGERLARARPGRDRRSSRAAWPRRSWAGPCRGPGRSSTAPPPAASMWQPPQPIRANSARPRGRGRPAPRPRRASRRRRRCGPRRRAPGRRARAAPPPAASSAGQPGAAGLAPAPAPRTSAAGRRRGVRARRRERTRPGTQHEPGRREGRRARRARCGRAPDRRRRRRRDRRRRLARSRAPPPAPICTGGYGMAGREAVVDDVAPRPRARERHRRAVDAGPLRRLRRERARRRVAAGR